MGASKRNFIIIAALLVIALAIAIASVPYRARRAVEKYQAKLLASGEKLNPEQLWPIPPPLESNGAPLFRQVMLNWLGGTRTNLFDKNAPVAMRMVAPGKAAVSWAQPDVHSGNATNTWEDIEAALSRFDSFLDDVHLAAQRPVFDFCLDYRQGYSLLLPHLAPLKRSVQFLTFAELCDLHRGDVMAACTNVETMLALVHATSTEPFTISQLVRIAMAQIAMTATWELLQSTNLTDAQLAAIQHDWSRMDFIKPGEQSLEFERAMGQMMLTRMRNSSAQFRQVLSLGGGGSSGGPLPVQVGEGLLREMVTETRETRWRFSQSYPDQLKALKGFQVLLQTFRQVEAGQSFVEAIRRQQPALDELGLHPPEDDNFQLFNSNWPDLRSLFSSSVLALGHICERVFNAEVARDLTTTALALKRYQLAHGNFPSDLSSLVPRFLPSTPSDPADNQPLRYRLKPDGSFLLYSIGLDGIDNGGDPSPIDGKTNSFSWPRGRDLVWPTPASSGGLAQTHPAGTADQPDRPL